MHHYLRSRISTFALALFTSAAGAQDHGVPAWQGDYTTRLEAYALLQTLNAELLSQNSATLTLDRWCDVHRMASPARIIAERVDGTAKNPTIEQREMLGVSADEPVRFRRVRLKCGEHVLSEAENWYVPGQLTHDMNRQLDTTDTPFGRAVKPLRFRRQTLSSKLLWSPLPANWEMQAATKDADSSRAPGDCAPPLAVPHEVLEHRALLTLPDGTPFSHVIETYTGEVLAFPEPPSGPVCD